jgi:hypothetical protein
MAQTITADVHDSLAGSREHAIARRICSVSKAPKLDLEHTTVGRAIAHNVLAVGPAGRKPGLNWRNEREWR